MPMPSITLHNGLLTAPIPLPGELATWSTVRTPSVKVKVIDVHSRDADGRPRELTCEVTATSHPVYRKGETIIASRNFLTYRPR